MALTCEGVEQINQLGDVLLVVQGHRLENAEEDSLGTFVELLEPGEEGEPGSSWKSS